MTIAQMLAALLRGETTPNALLDQSLSVIAARNPALNAFVAIDDRARAAARESDARWRAGTARVLEGIPLSVKDNLLTEGLPATWGSVGLRDNVPDHDELPVARLRAAGAVILGKTNVPELAVEGYTSNDLFGVTRNPWNPALTPGGSSGGAAASVAAGMVPAAIGTDGGGSIRRPACHNGLVGWKPSTGRIPRIDGFPTALSDFEVIGVLARTVPDAILLDAAMAGPDARDRRSLFASAPPWTGPARVLFVPRFGESPVDPEVAAATRAFAGALGDAGHAVRESGVFFDMESVAAVWRVISRAGVAWAVRQDPRIVPGASLRAMVEDAATITGADYADALDRVTALRRQCAELFGTVDVVLTPTAAALPWPAEQPYPTMIAGRPAGPRDHAVFTGWVNAAGLPAISLPTGHSGSGLPIGVQLVGGFGTDADLLALAAEVERGKWHLVSEGA